MKCIEMEKWCVSSNGEFFDGADFSSREEAIKACQEDEYSNYIGRAIKWEISTADEIELGKRIAKTVIDFINEKGLQPTCFLVVDIEEAKKDG